MARREQPFDRAQIQPAFPGTQIGAAAHPVPVDGRAVDLLYAKTGIPHQCRKPFPLGSYPKSRHFGLCPNAGHLGLYKAAPPLWGTSTTRPTIRCLRASEASKSCSDERFPASPTRAYQLAANTLPASLLAGKQHMCTESFSCPHQQQKRALTSWVCRSTKTTPLLADAPAAKHLGHQLYVRRIVVIRHHRGAGVWKEWRWLISGM